jgi:CDP-4-dehydro-6-deoxyglucose reductase, E1
MNKTSLRVSYAQAVHDDKETKRVVKVLNDHRTIMGPETEEFQDRVAKEFGKKFGLLVNSGSSANMLAIELLNLPEGSEVITPILTFSTTVAPLVRAGLIPVFAEVIEGKYIIDVDHVEKLITKKTKALMIPLLFGNVPEMDRLKSLAKKHNLLFVEDSCDTLGAQYKSKPTGTYSDISTTSFYGSHIITAGGGGGMIMVNSTAWRDRLKVLRGWGRTSSVFSESESVEKRFRYKLDDIQYDAKFIFDELGYNLLHPEIGAAFGNVQMDKLPKFRATREKNVAYLSKFFAKYEDFFILPIQDKQVRTQWLAYPLTIRAGVPFTRLELVKYLEENNIQTRPLFTGNILRQPAFKHIHHKSQKEGYPVTEHLMRNGFVIGCHHGMKKEHLQKIENVFETFLKKFS